MTDPKGFYRAQLRHDEETPDDEEQDENYKDLKGEHDRDLAEDR